MNLRNVLRAYSLLRQLSDDESALLNILRALNDNDREQLVASMSDKPSKKSTTKKPAGKGGSGKSARGESLAKQISGRAQSAIRLPEGATTDDENSGRCQAKRSDDRICMLLADHNIHRLPTAMDYHEFVAGKSDAQSAVGGS